ncbi:MAG: 2-succinyl-5-enolpyruvyl-6-hydroxy-3-cyclohexene-1-carboxylic-acid synthase [Terracoccus sp.]
MDTTPTTATSAELSLALLQQLWAGGVRDVVLAPGSRSAPLALAAHAADAAGDLRLHVRVDERSAGFLALGLATGSRRPVAVVTTSGTAVGNLLPAVMEAHHTGRRLVVVSADRPARLRGSGANQTTLQADLFGPFAPCHDLDAASAGDALDAAVASACAGPGPAQLNLQLDDPLLPEGDGPWWQRPSPTPVRGDAEAPAAQNHLQPGGAEDPVAAVEVLTRGPRTVVVAGDDAGPAARLLAEAGGWPLLAEPTSGARIGANAIRTHRLLLTTALRDRVERVVVVGHPTLSRPVTRLISDPALEVVAVRTASGVATDPGRVARVVDAVPRLDDRNTGSDTGSDEADDAWLQQWREADARLGALLDAALQSDAATAGPIPPLLVAAAVGRAVGADTSLVVGSSNPVRDLDVMAVPWPPHQRRFVVGNRGLAGIDGVVSTAIGVALGRRDPARTIAYLGDLTFVHDSGGLVIGPDEPVPSVTLVVLSDDGGAIFATLEQGAGPYAAGFERVFATPHGTDLAALCAAHHTAYERVTGLDRLEVALAERPAGIRVLEVPVSRGDRRAESARLRELARQAVPGPA